MTFDYCVLSQETIPKEKKKHWKGTPSKEKEDVLPQNIWVEVGSCTHQWAIKLLFSGDSHMDLGRNQWTRETPAHRERLLETSWVLPLLPGLWFWLYSVEGNGREGRRLPGRVMKDSDHVFRHISPFCLYHSPFQVTACPAFLWIPARRALHLNLLASCNSVVGKGTPSRTNEWALV